MEENKCNCNMFDLNTELYKKLYLIRTAEKKIQEYYPQDKMKTPMHMSMGEEAIVVGICQALKKEDHVFGSCRSHGLYLAKTGETDQFFAEMYGKVTGGAKGKAGSMHLSAPEMGLMGVMAIVAGGIPVAVGVAFANKRQKNNKIAAIFFGDGAIEEGCFWESLNVACLMKLPILFICEDNRFAKNTPDIKRHGYKNISEIVSKFDCNVFEEESTDAEVIYNLTRRAIDLMSANGMPCFLHLRYYRYLEHVGVNEYFNEEYRLREEFEKWKEKDPIDLQRKKLLVLGMAEDNIKKIEKEIDDKIGISVDLADKAPFAEISEVYKDVFL